ncbi:uncharacterized protein LOC135113856 [Scylla paramamosain]|uniref:uncharacterized protein LOC135113856 n=1 Tax=Scylla paramamosain TaxID=85552 RepID=UPI003082E2D4
MDYISQFTTDIRYVKRVDNAPVTTLSHNISALMSSPVNYAAIAADQAATFTTVSERFDHVHIALARPLPYSNGHRYLLTCVDCFTRWPLADITTDSVAQVFIAKWVSRFGVPLNLTSDRGSQSQRTDLHNSSAELVYGTMLRLPWEILPATPDPEPCSIQDFSTCFKSAMKSFQPVQLRAFPTKTFVHQDLATCSHVFIRVDAVNKPLQQP